MLNRRFLRKELKWLCFLVSIAFDVYSMPQFDIVSFYPQITVFAGIFIIFYVFLSKNILPKISQNLKLNKRISEIYNTLATRGLKDLNLLSHIYKPSQILSYLIYKETICLVFLQNSLKILTTSYTASLSWLSRNRKENSQVRLSKLNKTYLSVVNDIHSK